jgi:hypothetical protein
MPLLTPQDVLALRGNERIQARTGSHDPVPVVKLFDPCGAATWLLTELAEDGDTLFGLCDLGMGCPELGYVSLHELQSVRGRLGLPLERDQHFRPRQPLSCYTGEARELGYILT